MNSRKVFNPIVNLLLRSPLHSFLSHSTALLTIVTLHIDGESITGCGKSLTDARHIREKLNLSLHATQTQNSVAFRRDPVRRRHHERLGETGAGAAGTDHRTD
jgi:hypothetical protein